MFLSGRVKALGCAAVAAAIVWTAAADPAEAVRRRPPVIDVACESKDGDIQGPVTAGQAIDIVYTIIVSATQQTSNPVIVRDTLPAGDEFLVAGSSQECEDQNDGTVDCTFDPLPAGQTVVTIKVRIPDPQGDILNFAQVVANAADNSSTGNDGGQGTSCEDVIPVAPQGQAVLACVIKTADPNPNPLVKDTAGSIAYLVNFLNSGDATATNVVVTDTITGEDATYNTSNSTDDCGGLSFGDDIFDGVDIDCPIADIAPGGAVFSLAVNVTPTDLGIIRNEAFATYDSPEATGLETNICPVELTVTEEPGGGEGCTPGGWRNRTDIWESTTGILPDELFQGVVSDILNEVFVSAVLPGVLVTGETFPGEHDGAIWLNGGGIRKVYRHGMACLLNALHQGVDYDLTAEQCAEIIRNGGATDDGNFDINDVVDFNEQGCNAF